MMKKKMLVFGIVGMFLLTAFTVGSATSTNVLSGNSVVSPGINKYGYDDAVRLAKSDTYVAPLVYHPGYTPRGKIWIEGDNEFTTGNGVTGGSGTKNDPYIIEGWETPRIWIQDTTAYFIIRNCRIYGMRGVDFYNVQNGVIRDSILYDESGIPGWGMQLDAGSYNCVIDNVTIDEYGWAFIIAGTCFENTVIYCNLTSATYGFCVDGYNNIIHHNNIREISGWYATSVLSGDNQWDDGVSKGNYWGDYHGVDLNRDGIGDTPYIITLKNIDHYPFMKPVGSKSKSVSKTMNLNGLDLIEHFFLLLEKLLFSHQLFKI